MTHEIKQAMSGLGRTRSGVLQVQQVYSTVHKDRPCQPCILCKQGNHSKYFHPKFWKDPTLLERLKQYEPSLNILSETCICQLCRDDLSNLAVYATTGESPYVYRNFMVCTQRMGDNEMRRPRVIGRAY